MTIVVIHILKNLDFFERRYDSKGNLILHAGKSKIMVFETGIKVMAKNTKKIIEIINQTGIHLTGKSIANMTDYVGMIKEICGNSLLRMGRREQTVSLLCLRGRHKTAHPLATHRRSIFYRTNGDKRAIP